MRDPADDLGMLRAQIARLEGVDVEAVIPLSSLFPSREWNPWRPPGYYVPTSICDLGAGPCAHCGDAKARHTGVESFCPRAPWECTVYAG